MFKNKTLTKLKTEAVSRLIVADIYGGFCRSVFTQFCPGWPLITRRELRKITGIITRRPRHSTKICCFTAPLHPKRRGKHIIVVGPNNVYKGGILSPWSGEKALRISSMSWRKRLWMCSLPQVNLSLVSYGLRKWSKKFLVPNKLKIVFSRVENLQRVPDFFKLSQHIDVVVANQQHLGKIFKISLFR